ncbi:MAG TPA: protease inhibitor I42 family protein [Dehalococcoidia bacterium]|nr:protease inhibitor I42 family protein [Dehalococcoidia bacterium]
MKRINLLLIFCVLTLALLTVSCGGDDESTPSFPAEVQLTDADDGSTVQLALRGELIVALASNPTTGFGWSVGEGSDEGLVLQGEPRYVPAGSTTPVVGAGGTEVFSFEAEDSGTSRLVLEYRRPFEPDVAPEQTFSVTVEIR